MYYKKKPEKRGQIYSRCENDDEDEDPPPSRKVGHDDEGGERKEAEDCATL